MTKSGAPFARKFDKGSAVLDKIDREILNRRMNEFTPGGWCIGLNDDPCGVRGDPTLLRPGPGSRRFEELVVRLLAHPNFRSQQCVGTWTRISRYSGCFTDFIKILLHSALIQASEAEQVVEVLAVIIVTCIQNTWYRTENVVTMCGLENEILGKWTDELKAELWYFVQQSAWNHLNAFLIRTGLESNNPAAQAFF